ncbi:MAG: hypothetical protein LUD29_01370 [Clostridia bacterium]|nr:hypothetical protein [Clostridia bacterium]
MGDIKIKKDWVNAFSFWAIAISAILYLVNGILGLCNADWGRWWEITSGILSFIAAIFILIAVIAPAWRYARTREHKFWKVLAIIFMVVYSIGIILQFIAALIN